MIFLTLIYSVAVFFWCRYLYLHSFRTKEDRAYTFKKTSELFLYIPLGLQAAFLFCYAVYEAIPVGFRMSDLFTRLILRDLKIDDPDFDGLKIVFAGSMMIGASYTSIKMTTTLEDRVSAVIAQIMLFALNCFFLKEMVQNIYLSAGFPARGHSVINLQDHTLWIFMLIAVPVLSFINTKAEGPLSWLRYTAVAARTILVYCLICFVLVLPRIIHLLIKYL